jgi:hypothetical protein
VKVGSTVVTGCILSWKGDNFSNAWRMCFEKVCILATITYTW